MDYVSVLGLRLIEPLIDLVETLESLRPQGEENEVQCGRDENGYSCSVIVLSALILESALNRTRYLRRDATDTHVAEYLRVICANPNLIQDVNEVFAIRDAIVHNHIWKAKIDPVAMKFISPPKLIPGYGRKRFRDVLDRKTRLSRKLKLNLFPPKICRRDAYVALKAMGRALEALEEIDSNYFPIRFEYVSFRHKPVRLPEVLNALPNG